jgi:hypothetical protein
VKKINAIFFAPITSVHSVQYVINAASNWIAYRIVMSAFFNCYIFTCCVLVRAGERATGGGGRQDRDATAETFRRCASRTPGCGEPLVPT